MKKQPLEPGLLSAFRLYVAVRLVFVLIAGGFYVFWYRPAIGWTFFLSAGPFLIDILLLFVFLSWPWFARVLGRSYLPLALAIAVLGPIFQVGYILPLYEADSAFAFLLGFSLLLVPYILTAWQYSFGWVLILTLSTALLEFLLLSSIAGADLVRLRWGTVALIGRSLLAIFVSYVVSILIEQQRQQRSELANANRKLLRYASTLEHLAISHERNRLARELHDTLAHALSGLAVQLDAIMAIWDPIPPKARLMLERSLSITRIGLDETRRALQALRATPLEDMGLSLAIRNLAENVAERSNLALDLDLMEQLGDLTPEVEQCYYRVAQEALENIVRHAGASRMEVFLRQSGGQLVLQVTDDGRGYATPTQSKQGHLGVRGMRERAELVGAILEIQSQEGAGTSLYLRYGEKQ